ncbi:PREDICTED: uncharacterized protein LOC109484875 [Branchiostoma belcheri]|uniref:Uncharacterized protein LOC109484875 n=1 Tax=Branchiostoma belcheri TaxID=7741 RepID=A0A6P5AL31_BRABE|nr:PREDICTED: uncharacterized protein LOC109484875 [Branchiostoma belcheri]XP_019643792.1 PREDICTED: uncharacterized protein LOC109484875 [Branchiostoma belcheri]
MSETKMTSLANKLQKLELCLKSQHGQEVGYGRTLREAILGKDDFIEVEVLKSLGDLQLEKGTLSKNSTEFDKAAALYAAALLRCKDPDVGETVEHRIRYMEKLSRQLLQGYSPHFRWLSPDYWGTADSNILRVTEICDKLDRSVRDSFEQTYTDMLVTAIANSDMFLELEVLKSLGDFYLEKGKTTSDVSQFSKASAMYSKALTCGGPATKLTLEHRIRYTDKIREAVKRKPSSKKPRPRERSPHMRHRSENITRTDTQDQHLHAADSTREYTNHLKEGDSSLARADLDSAEQHFADALKLVHVRDPTAQQYRREVEPLCKLGDVYSKRGQQTGDGGDFVKAAALYNAAIARSEDQVLNGNIETAIREVDRLFLKCMLDVHCVAQHNTEKHKKQLKEMRDQIKLEMETIDQQLDPYVHAEDDPCVKEIEAKRAQAVRQLFERISQQRKAFISLLVEECIWPMGPLPCKYALIGLGSQATGLVTPYSDLEFAILVEEENEECLEYFRNLTHYLHLKVVNLGETILPALGIKPLNDFHSENPLDNWYYDSVTPRGLAFDGSMPKASKTPLGRQGTKNKQPSELICTPEHMVLKLQDDVTLYLKEGYHLATILRNPYLIAGDQDLIDTYMDITWKILQADGGKMAQQLAQETRKENMKRIRNEETITCTARLIDVKKELYRLPALAVDSLALSSGIIPTTVWETIEEMKNQQVISPNNAHHLTVLTSISAELRLRTYMANGGQKENLSAMASMETEQHGQESSIQTNGEAQTNMLKPVFYIQNEKQLFRYYYTSIPLKKVLSESSEGKANHYSFPELYNNSSKVCGMMYQEVCKYQLAISYFLEALKKDEQIDTEKMDLLGTLGSIWLIMGDYQKSIDYTKGALQLCRGIYGQNTGHHDTALLLSNLGGAWHYLGDNRKAISYYKQALQMYRSIYGLGTAHAHIATSFDNLGSAWSDLGDYRKAISYHEQALQMHRSIYGQDIARPHIAISLNNLGETWSKLGNYRKAISYYEQALQIDRSNYGQGTAHPYIAISLNNLGTAWSDLCDHRKAANYHEQALMMHRSIYGQGIAHPLIAKSLNNLGSAWRHLGDNRKAISYYEQALQMRRRIYGQGREHPEIATSLNNLGSAWLDLDDSRKAISHFEQALQMFKAIYGQSTPHPYIAGSLINLGGAWGDLGDNRKAISYYEQALQMYRSIYGQRTEHPDIANLLNNLGEAWSHLGDFRKAVGYNEQALQMYRSVYGQGTEHPDIAMSLNNLGTAWRHLGNYAEAISYYEHALQMYRSIYGTEHPDIANTLNNLGSAWWHQGNYRKAISYYEQALQMYRGMYGQGTAHSDIAASLNNLGSTWYKLGDRRKATSLCQEALAMARLVYGQDESNPSIKAIESNYLALSLLSKVSSMSSTETADNR